MMRTSNLTAAGKQPVRIATVMAKPQPVSNTLKMMRRKVQAAADKLLWLSAASAVMCAESAVIGINTAAAYFALVSVVAVMPSVAKSANKKDMEI